MNNSTNKDIAYASGCPATKYEKAAPGIARKIQYKTFVLPTHVDENGVLQRPLTVESVAACSGIKVIRFSRDLQVTAVAIPLWPDTTVLENFVLLLFYFTDG